MVSATQIIDQRRRSRRARGREGLTLIEIMIVIIVIALAAGGVTMAIGAVTRTKLRSGCFKLISASRFAYNRAIARGNTVRIKIDFGDGNSPSTMALEEAPGHVTLSRMDDPRRRNAEDSGDGDAAEAVDPWTAAQARLETTFEPTFGASPFSPITGIEGEVLDRYKTQNIGGGIRVVRMYSPHEPEPREEGIGSIYFFPGGQTEHAVVQLTDGGETIYSIELHPLTGRAQLHDWAFEPEDLAEEDDEDLSDVRDPGR